MATYILGEQVPAGSLVIRTPQVFLPMKMVTHISQFQGASLL
jgi:hypothetical protein